MKPLLLSSLFFLSASLSLHATSVSLSSSPQGRDVIDVGGLALSDGDLVLIGTFSNPAAIADVSFSDLENAAGWSQFGASLQIGSIFGHAGKLLGTDTDLSTAADAFDGQTIYLWVFNAPTISEATQQGIYTAQAGIPAWQFPVNAGGVGDLITLDANDPSILASGNVGAVTAGHLSLQPIAAVPEPSSYGLIGIAAVALAVSRLRRVSR